MNTTNPPENTDTPEIDVFAYTGQVSMAGYEQLCEQIDISKTQERALLVLSTPGGDAHAGFRIARAMQHHYPDNFDVLVPRYCKSAGTLICIGANNLYLANQSELGPLDVQIKKTDELVGRNSGLDILQALGYLQNQALDAFKTYVNDLTKNEGLSTRIASDIASNLTSGLLSPIFAQIEPMRLAEMQRATEIAMAYGFRLNEKSEILKTNGLAKLVVQYPSHGFIIDRKEARTIFKNVHAPEGSLKELSDRLDQAYRPYINNITPIVNKLSTEPEEKTNASVPSVERAEKSNDRSESASIQSTSKPPKSKKGG